MISEPWGHLYLVAGKYVTHMAPTQGSRTLCGRRWDPASITTGVPLLLCRSCTIVRNTWRARAKMVAHRLARAQEQALG